MSLKIGDLAKRAGVSIKTLHHYDAIGLLSPARRNDAGHRVYTEPELLRLQQILSLKALGLSLPEIGSVLPGQEREFLGIFRLHQKKLQEEIRLRQELLARLEAVLNAISCGKSANLDELLNLIETSIMFEKYYSKEQLDTLAERAKALGEEGMRQAEKRWSDLLGEIRLHKERKSDPASEAVQELARRYKELINEFSGGDKEIENSLAKMYTEEGPSSASQGMLDSDLLAFINKALSVATEFSDNGS